MVPLLARGHPKNINNTLVGVIARNPNNVGTLNVMRGRNSVTSVSEEDIICQLTARDQTPKTFVSRPFIFSIDRLNHLFDGDVVAVNPDGHVNTLFQIKSHHNSLFITDRCNSNCLMCSQPPKNKDDLDFYFELNRKLIDLLPEGTETIGITGGEPTLLGDRLIEMIKQIDDKLPRTNIHMLTNGRVYAWKEVAKKTASSSENLVVGIPLYSDNYLDHDYIVQAKEAFNQTMLGLHNLARFGQRIEIRIVLHKLSYKRLPQLARFIYKNLTFTEHVAFMGLEYTGYTPHNHDLLWIEPSQYMNELETAVTYLDSMGMNVSIYNLQHCLMRKSLWKFSRRSISDWKQEYVSECNNCLMLMECGGVFSTSKKLSSEIVAIMH